MPDSGIAAGKTPEPPVPISAPPTQTIPQLNQQINVFPVVPPDVWSQFSPEQALQLITQALKMAGDMSERQFQLAMDQASRDHKSERLRVILGAAVYIVLLATAGVLAWRGHGVVAGLVITGAASSMFTIFGRWIK